MENNINHMNKNFIWAIVVVVVAIVAYTLGAKSASAPTVSTDTAAPEVSTPVTPVQTTQPVITTKPTVTTTAPKTTSSTGVRVYTPNGYEIWVSGANTEVDTVVKMGTVGTLNLSLVDDKGNVFPLGSFKIDPKIEVQRSNVYVTTRQAPGKYKILASLTANGVTVTDTSDNFFTISN